MPINDVWRALSIIAGLPLQRVFFIKLSIMGLSSVRAFKAMPPP